jgi:hypothetical protein
MVLFCHGPIRDEHMATKNLAGFRLVIDRVISCDLNSNSDKHITTVHGVLNPEPKLIICKYKYILHLNTSTCMYLALNVLTVSIKN